MKERSIHIPRGAQIESLTSKGIKSFSLDSRFVATVINIGYTPAMERDRKAGDIYPDELKLKEILSEGIPLLIPRVYLFGRQEKESYDNGKRRSAEKRLKKEGINFLLQEPIIVCALPLNNDTQLVIVDGHHRTRYAGLHKIHLIPSIVYTPGQLVEAFSIIKHGTKYTPETLTALLDKEVAEASASFEALPNSKRPVLLTGYTDIQKLPFERFSPVKT